MKKNAIARTDNDLLDDVVGGQSLAAAREARVKDGAEVRRAAPRANSAPRAHSARLVCTLAGTPWLRE